MHNVVSARVDGQRCTSCNHFVVDAWICADCAWYSVADNDIRPRGAGFVARGRQRLVDQGAAFLLWLDLCGVVDSNITPVDAQRSAWRGEISGMGTIARSRRVRSRLQRESNSIGDAVRAGWSPPVGIGKYGESPLLSVRRAARRARKEAA